MQETTNLYTSEFGWSISLPPTWKRLSRRNGGNRAPVAVFSTPEDWNLSLTWMVSTRPVDHDSLIKFDSATMLPGRITNDEAKQALDSVLPVIGDLVRAAAIVLPDGQRAIEVVTTIGPADSLEVEKMTYALIFPRKRRGEYKDEVFFQRINFTASPDAFHDRIQDVVKAARTFRAANRAA